MDEHNIEIAGRTAYPVGYQGCTTCVLFMFIDSNLKWQHMTEAIHTSCRKQQTLGHQDCHALRSHRIQHRNLRS